MLSIIITHHQTPVLLKLCLKSIQENIDPIKHEILVIDSQAQPDTQELLEEKFPQVKYLSFIKNVGYAKLVNAGIRAAQGEYFLILNADILILKNAVSEMLTFMEKNHQVGIIGPRLLTFTNQPQASCFRFPTPSSFLARRTFFGKLKWGEKKIKEFLINNRDFSSAQPVDWIQGSAMLVRRKAVNKVGLMDERFFMYLEDTDWCRRFWQNGYQVIYLPQAQVSHYYYRISKKRGGFLDIFFNKYTRLHIISAIKYFWKWRKETTKI
ncbi:MAG: glycosyltransferase family 2 protein [Patescibacteria group bacterium]